MYTKKQVIEQNIAIRATTLEEAEIIVRAFPECFDDAEKWIKYWNSHFNCYCPNSIYGGATHDREAVYKTVISISDITRYVPSTEKETSIKNTDVIRRIFIDGANFALSLQQGKEGKPLSEVRNKPFDWDLLQNPKWLPSETEKKWMGDEYDKAVKEYEEAEAKVLYKNIYLQWESCDCGGGYGCSHGSWVYEAYMHNCEGKPFIDVQDDGFHIQGSNLVFIEDYGKITIGDFEDACRIAGVELVRTYQFAAPPLHIDWEVDIMEGAHKSRVIYADISNILHDYNGKSELAQQIVSYIMNTLRTLPVAGDGWVKCSERMPENRTTVLAYGGGRMAIMHYTHGKFYYAPQGLITAYDWVITDWTLPTPPIN